MKENEDFAEVISEILIQLHNMEAMVGQLEEKMERIERRVGFAVQRIVKTESRLENFDRIFDELHDFKQEQLSLNKKIIDHMNNKTL